MPEHKTFSLTTILNTNHLQPQLYNHMIHQIKSPLQQQSIDLTHDDSRQHTNVPRRPNIPPPPPVSPLARLSQIQFNQTFQSLEVDQDRSRKKSNRQYRDNVIESIVVSPLQYEINMKSQESEDDPPMCGGILGNLIKKEAQVEVFMPLRSNSYKRRPIFNKTFQQKTNTKKPRKTLQQAITTLNRVNEPQLATFLQLMGNLQRQLKQIDFQKEQMQKDLSTIYERLSHETNYTAQVSEYYDSHERILRRLHSRNAGQLITRVFQRKKEDIIKGQKYLEKLFGRLSSIEKIISQFIKIEQSVDYLYVVYDFLSDNFGSITTLKQQIQGLYDSLGIQLSTNGLELIWKGSNTGVLSRLQFVEGITMNDLLIREQKGGFESSLLEKGFRRNG